jgi:hypothetical protein
LLSIRARAETARRLGIDTVRRLAALPRAPIGPPLRPGRWSMGRTRRSPPRPADRAARAVRDGRRPSPLSPSPCSPPSRSPPPRRARPRSVRPLLPPRMRPPAPGSPHAPSYGP